MFRLPFKYAMVVTALGLVVAGSFLLVMMDLFNHLGRGDPFSFISWLIGNLVLLVIIMIVVAVIISAITWGYWLGDLGNGGRREDRSEEALAALAVLEKKYADREITMSEYLALRKGIDRDRPRY